MNYIMQFFSCKPFPDESSIRYDEKKAVSQSNITVLTHNQLA